MNDANEAALGFGALPLGFVALYPTYNYSGKM